MTAYHCAEDAGGCGATFTPDHDTRPRRDPEINCEWRWCPDCLRMQAAKTEAGDG